MKEQYAAHDFDNFKARGQGHRPEIHVLHIYYS